MDFNLSLKLCEYLDKHVVCHLLEHLAVVGAAQQRQRKRKKLEEGASVVDESGDWFAKEQIDAAKAAVLGRTRMMDAWSEITSQSIDESKQKIIAELESVEGKCGDLIDLLSDFDLARKLRDSSQLKIDFLKSQFQMADANQQVDALFDWCRLRYDCGYYEITDQFLGFCAVLISDRRRQYQALWGQLSCLIVQGKWDESLLVIQRLRERIDELSKLSDPSKSGEEPGSSLIEEKKDSSLEDKASDSGSEGLEWKPAQVMRERVWLMHWALVVCFNKHDALDYLVDLIQSNSSSTDFVHSMQALCPHLLRYLAAAALISENSGDGSSASKVKDLINVAKYAKDELANYRDPLTEFLRVLFLDCDFDLASRMLSQAMPMVQADFFLWYYQRWVLESARLVFFKQYCRLHCRISVEKLAKLLLMNEQMAMADIHSWIVNALRQENIDGALDVVENTLHIKFQTVDVYKSMDDNAKALNARTVDLVKTLYDRFFKQR